MGIVERLRTHDDLDCLEAAEMLEFLFAQFQMHSPKMDGQHGWRMMHGSFPMTRAIGRDIETAICAAMRAEQAGS